jgi:hypothetical protein
LSVDAIADIAVLCDLNSMLPSSKSIMRSRVRRTQLVINESGG